MLDLRPPEADPAPREAIAAALGARPELAVPDDPALVAALAGEPDPAPLAPPRAALARAGAAYGELRCDEARRAAREAALGFLRAAPAAEVRDPVGRALAIELLCADGAGDRSAAAAAARRLRGLGHDPPPGIPAPVWWRYPAVDAATNVFPAPVRIESDPPGARVRVDLADAGATPVEAPLPPGEAWIVAWAQGRAPAVEVIEVREGTPATVRLALPPTPPDRWRGVRERVARWRAARAAAPAALGPTPADVAGTLREAGIDLAVVLLAGAGEAEVWALDPGATAARPAGRAPAGEPAAVAAATAEAARGLGSAAVAVDPVGVPVSPVERVAAPRRSWWIYAAVAGAAAATVGAFLLLDGRDTQRIEIRFP